MDGPFVVTAAKLETFMNPIHPFRIFFQWHYYHIKVVEVWLGQPSETNYQLWDLNGYCPGEYPYCPDGDLVFDAKKCVRIEGKFHADTASCEYRDPNTDKLLVYLGDLDSPSGLEAGAEFILFAADYDEGQKPRGVWSFGDDWAIVEDAGADLMKSTLTNWERILYRTQEDGEVDVGRLFDEDFPGSRAVHHPYDAGPRWIPQWMLAQRILERMVTPYLRDHPEDRPFVESALSGPLLQEYLSPTPLPPEFQSDAN